MNSASEFSLVRVSVRVICVQAVLRAIDHSAVSVYKVSVHVWNVS